MEDFLYFFTFQDPSITWVVLGITLLGIGSAYVGTFSFLDKKALLGDAISHAVLPGICLGFALACNGWLVYETYDCKRIGLGLLNDGRVAT